MVLLGSGAGYLSIDEATYHLMVKNLADGRMAEILNGFHEFPSIEFKSALLVAEEKHLAAQYPVFYPVVALPFYWLLGFKGLFLLNVLAFFGTLAITYLIAKHYTHNHHLALLSCFLLGTATYFADYAVAAWPHAITCLLLVTAFYTLIRADVFGPESATSKWVICSGLCLGIAVGMRYDAIFMLPALVLPLLLQRPLNFSAICCFFIGLLPSLLLLSISNWYKFGEFRPFSYGSHGGGHDVSVYLPFLALAVAGALAIACCPIRHLKKLITAGVAAVLLALLFSPTIRQAFYQFCHGSFQLLVDFRIRDLNISEPALSRGPSGSMVYLGSIKRSLLESIPWLPLLFIPLVSLLKQHDSKSQILLGYALFLPIVCFFVPYAFLAWHGGLGLNLRYWIPFLPFVSILAACGCFALFNEPLSRQKRRLTHIIIGLTLISLFVISIATGLLGLKSLDLSLKIQEMVFLNIPLLLSAGLIASLLFGVTNNKSQLLQTIKWLLVVTCVSWGIGATYTYDIPRSTLVRNVNNSVAAKLAELTEQDAVILTTAVDPIWGIIEYGNYRIANPRVDNFADFKKIAIFYLKRGQAAYAALGNDEWDKLETENVLSGLSVKTIFVSHGGEMKQLFLSLQDEQTSIR